MFTREKKQKALQLLQIVQDEQEAAAFKRRLRSATDQDPDDIARKSRPLTIFERQDRKAAIALKK